MALTSFSLQWQTASLAEQLVENASIVSS